MLLINGPNLDRLGRRDPKLYGTATLAEIEKSARATGTELGVEVDCFQSNSEEELIAAVHRAADSGAAVVINAGALSHYSYALADALEMIESPKVEVHISNIMAREPWRHHSVISPVVNGTITGLGPTGYRLAIEAAVELLGDLSGA